LGGAQNIEKEGKLSDIEKSEASGGSKSEAPIERGGGNRKDSQRPSHGPQKETELDLDAISECLRTERAGNN
jgi:hypothetical protein